MIEELRIRNLGVIDDATIEWGPGLTVLTGETGAGKTMVLTGLDLIRGGRAESGLVRSGAERAEVDGQWLLPPSALDPIRGRLDDLGAVVEESPDGEALILSRSIASSGRSRAVIGGRSVPAAALAEITDGLVAVHGQADQLGLRDPRRQRDLIDRFGGSELLASRSEFSVLLEAYREARRELDDLVTHRQDREREAALLRHGIEEIDAVDPLPGEDSELKERATLLAGATDVLAATGAAHESLTGGDSGDSGAVDLLAQAIRELQRAEPLDPALTPMRAEVARLLEAVGIVASELASHSGGVDADPARLAEVEERRRRISELKRRYGPELPDVLAWRETAALAVSEVDGSEGRHADLTEQIAALETQVRSGAEALTRARSAAAETFAGRVTGELRELAMPDAVVTVRIDTVTDLDDFTSSGADAVHLLLVPHRGSDPRPLAAGASGGELSRVMLAIEVVLAGENPVPTFVFDEVDAGIGGRVAVEVGRRLARLARSAQVLVVTHLPQVAAFADTHIVVTKDSSGQITGSSVVAVDGQDRVRELVRMLSGLEDSSSGAQHAEELLELADSERAGS